MRKEGPLDVWHYVCKSNWMPFNHSMVAIQCRRGCRIKIVAEFPNGDLESIDKGVFRCYCSIPHFTVSPYAMKKQHAEGQLMEGQTPDAVKWSMVGTIDPELLENPDKPQEFDPDSDCLRKPNMDRNRSLEELKQECSLM